MLFFFWPRLKMIALDVDVESRDLRLRSVISCISLYSSSAQPQPVRWPTGLHSLHVFGRRYVRLFSHTRRAEHVPQVKYKEVHVSVMGFEATCLAFTLHKPHFAS